MAYKTQQIIDALIETRGMKTLAAKKIGCSYNTIQRHIDNHPTVREAYETAHNEMGDAVELRLYQKAMAGDTTAMIFMLKTKFRDRGYSEKLNIQISWKDEMIQSIKRGEVEYDVLKQTAIELGKSSDLAEQLFREANVTIPTRVDKGSESDAIQPDPKRHYSIFEDSEQE